MALRNEQQRALITGATSGIGRATAARFAREGMAVGILAEAADAVEQTVRDIRGNGGNAFGVHADLSRPEGVMGLIDRVEEEYGSIDILVNNAGIGMQADILETRDEDLRRLFEVNFLSMFTLSRDALRRMSERGSGRIINISSASGRRALPGMSVYACTKAAMHALSQAMRVEARASGVRVVEILPMTVRTPFFEQAVNRSRKSYAYGGWSITPEALAEKILAAVHHPRPEVYTSSLARLAFIVDAVHPGWLDAILIRRRAKGL